VRSIPKKSAIFVVRTKSFSIMKNQLSLLFVVGLLFASTLLHAQNINYSARCVATKMKHDCDYAFNEEGRFSVQISDNLNFATWYRAGDGTGNMNKCLKCDGDANTTNGHTCSWNILLISKTDVSVNTLRMSFRATEDDATTDVNDWWMDDDCTYTLTGQDVVLSTLTAGVDNDIVVGQNTDPRWFVTYRFNWDYVAVQTPAPPTALQNPACLNTMLPAVPSTQNDVTWYWQGTNPTGTSTANPSTTAYPVSVSGVYYLRAQGNTNSVWSQYSSSVYVEVQTPSVDPTGINITNNNTPVGTIKTLTPVGGTLGTGAVWAWYADAGFTALIDTGNFLNVDPTGATTYWLRAESDCDTSLSVSVTVLVNTSGLQEASADGETVVIYPNPAEELLFVETTKLFNIEDNAIISIYDLTGKQVFSTSYSGSRTQLDIAAYKQGFYILNFKSTAGEMHFKFVKK
jgi:hypothetical protein